ncbi:hypothetical protein OZD61_02730 [Wolbachia endosymbiont of Drosophila bocki]|uniref:hypothetical protein n=1 Tax=unclassified Wolbachia TaxID=2640676 RepID=UPI0023A98A83|nr:MULTISPECIES: hypothetical protein [unclassified Wolbachia]MDE5057700.1 hypothetical protein [Wolbachia endosymbiont of Drosophila bocki]MDE5067313.1 hypothetical protein [Wolbachia endosymbiont of Drosophila leontia]
MKYRKRTLIFLAVITLIIIALLFRYNSHFHKDVVHLKSDDKEFKKKPENSIESTILHREKEVYDHVFHPDD